MSARDLNAPRVGAAWLGVIEREDGDDILTFTAPPGVAPLSEAEYEALVVRVMVRAVAAQAANLRRASMIIT